MTELEQRLDFIEEQATENTYPLVRAINELTRQVARLVNIKVFELGLEDEPEPPAELETAPAIAEAEADDPPPWEP